MGLKNLVFKTPHAFISLYRFCLTVRTFSTHDVLSASNPLLRITRDIYTTIFNKIVKFTEITHFMSIFGISMENASKWAPTSPMFGLVVLEIAHGILHKQDHWNSQLKETSTVRDYTYTSIHKFTVHELYFRLQMWGALLIFDGFVIVY